MEPALPAVSLSLGAPSTSFIGRAREVERVSDLLLRGHRLVTITGPGGVGKTRLATAVASSLQSSGAFPGGCIIVTLASLSDESLVVPTVARALGVMIESDDPAAERIAAAVADRRMLVVLDNFEHVLGAAVEIADLISAAPALSVLATSRRPLRLTLEQEFPLHPFEVPSTESSGSIEKLMELPAVAIFVARAAASNPSFTLTEANASSVLTICERLDGLPLALELAAARIKLLSPQALASRLTGRLQLLTSGPRDAPRRQQTLRDAIAWSYGLLTDDEQKLFRRFAVFAGGATFDAIEAVAGTDADGQPMDAFALAMELVDHSLLVEMTVDGGEARVRMLETIREFALMQLEEHGEAEATRDAHAAYFLARAEYSAEREYGQEEGARIRGLEPDLDNVRGALSWYLNGNNPSPQRARLGLRLAGAMDRFWDVRGYLQEEEEWLTRALALAPVDVSPERGVAMTALGVNAWFAGRFDLADERQREALAIWRELDNPPSIMSNLWFLAMAAAKRGDVDQLRTLHTQSEIVAPRLGVTLWKTVPNSILALIALCNGDGYSTLELFASTLSYHEANGFFWAHAWVLGLMGEAGLLVGDRPRSLRLYQQSLAEFRDHGDVYATLDAIVAIASHAEAMGEAGTAARLIGAGARIRTRVGHRTTWASIDEPATIERIRQTLGDETFDREVALGREMDLPDAVAIALAIRPAHGPAVAPGAPAAKLIADPYGLSPRELDVLRLLTEGKSNTEIGEALFISPRTAGTHVTNILGKLGVGSRSAAVALALTKGLI